MTPHDPGWKECDVCGRMYDSVCSSCMAARTEREAWEGYTKRSAIEFVSWVDDPEDRTRYAIIRAREEGPAAGLQWVRLRYSLYDRRIILLHASSGRFYSDVPEHPEGPVEWAKASARRDAEKGRDLHAAFNAGTAEAWAAYEAKWPT